MDRLVGRPAYFAVMTFDQTIIYYSKIPHSCSRTHASRVQNWFSARCAELTEIPRSDNVPGEWESRLARAEFPHPSVLLAPHRLYLLCKHWSFISAFYTSAPDVFEEGSRFHHNSTLDALFIQVEQIRLPLPSVSSKWKIYLYLSEPADLQGIRLVFMCNSWKSLLPQQHTD